MKTKDIINEALAQFLEMTTGVPVTDENAVKLYCITTGAVQFAQKLQEVFADYEEEQG